MFISSFIGLVLASTISAKVIDIQVSDNNATLVFNPEAIAADPGDQVVYHFNPKNHTVTQSSFAGPCSPKEGGFDSDFRPVTADVDPANRPTFTVTVNDTQPIWVYCKQAGNTPASHCGAGMVHAINCGNDSSPNSFTNFKQAALAIGAQLKAQNMSSTMTTGGPSIPPAPTPSLRTDTITLGSDVWTTTYDSYPGSPGPTPASSTGNTIDVIVGGPNGNLSYTPNRVTASPRDTIRFIFQVKNHTVTQSSFAAPCVPLTDKTTGQRIGFSSGFMPVAANTTDFPTWTIKINDTTPIWAYCGQTGHCGSGMVFAVNSVEDSQQNFAAFQNLAKTLNGTASNNSTNSSNTTTTGGGKTNGEISNSVGSGLIIAFVAALAGSFL